MRVATPAADHSGRGSLARQKRIQRHHQVRRQGREDIAPEPFAVNKGEAASVQEVAPAPSVVSHEGGPCRILSVDRNGMANMGGVRADLVAPPCVDAHRCEAKDSAAKGRIHGVGQNLQPRDRGLASGAHPCWPSAALVPAQRCVEAAARHRHPSVHQHPVVPEQRAGAELHLQVAVGIGRLRYEYEARGWHVKAVQKALVPITRCKDGPGAHRPHALHVP
mmetsp:Transcript_83095/g.247919  ORF Transcript_83095/g.247919 Transcript_83095/m.247919 type:complete len:221 (-) Transcript_83095:171-833(-)